MTNMSFHAAGRIIRAALLGGLLAALLAALFAMLSACGRPQVTLYKALGGGWAQHTAAPDRPDA